MNVYAQYCTSLSTKGILWPLSGQKLRIRHERNKSIKASSDGSWRKVLAGNLFLVSPSRFERAWFRKRKKNHPMALAIKLNLRFRRGPFNPGSFSWYINGNLKWPRFEQTPWCWRITPTGRVCHLYLGQWYETLSWILWQAGRDKTLYKQGEHS